MCYSWWRWRRHFIFFPFFFFLYPLVVDVYIQILFEIPDCRRRLPAVSDLRRYSNRIALPISPALHKRTSASLQSPEMSRYLFPSFSPPSSSSSLGDDIIDRTRRTVTRNTVSQFFFVLFLVFDLARPLWQTACTRTSPRATRPVDSLNCL